MVSHFLSNQTHKTLIFSVGKKIENRNETKTLGFTRTDTLTPESEPPGTEFSGTVSIISFRLRGFEDGGLGGSGLFNLAGDCFESHGILGSVGGAFSFADFGFLDGLGLDKLGLGDEGGSVECVSLKIAFLGCMKCFIVSTNHRDFWTERVEMTRINIWEDKGAKEKDGEQGKRERDRDVAVGGGQGI